MKGLLVPVAARALWGAIADGELLTWTAQTLGAALAGLALGAGLSLLVAAIIGLIACRRTLAAPAHRVPARDSLGRPAAGGAFGVRLRLPARGLHRRLRLLLAAGDRRRRRHRTVEPLLLDVARVLRMGWAARVGKVVLPAATPKLFLALRLSAGVSLIVAVTVEIAINPFGLGFAMIQTQQTLHPDLMFAVLISAAGRC